MYQFNNQLEVGQLAMIINTRKTANAPLIGKIVTVEMLPLEGENIGQYFEGGGIVKEGSHDTAVISGVNTISPCMTQDGTMMNSGFARIKRSYLMPLPPLEEKEVKREMELTQ